MNGCTCCLLFLVHGVLLESLSGVLEYSTSTASALRAGLGGYYAAHKVYSFELIYCSYKYTATARSILTTRIAHCACVFNIRYLLSTGKSHSIQSRRHCCAVVRYARCIALGSLQLTIDTQLLSHTTGIVHCACVLNLQGYFIVTLPQ